MKNMMYQKYIPEGWNDKKEIYTQEELQNAMKKNKVLESTVKEYDRNNTYIDLGNNNIGIIPKNKLGVYNKRNKYIQFKVEGINDNIYMLSRKAVQEESLNWAINELECGEKINGIVRGIENYGAFVEIGGGTVGLLHIEDISKARMKSPKERLSIGQKIPVIIKSINKEEKKLNLSYKEILGTWEENIKDFKEGQIVKGIAREIAKGNKGIFIELKPNLVGMAEYKKGIEYGQNVNVYIKKIIPEKEKVKLIIK